MQRLLFSGPIGTRVIDKARAEGVDITPARAMEIINLGAPVVSEILEEYVTAGADIILSPTLCANRASLSDVKSVTKANHSLVKLTKKAAPDLPSAAMLAWPATSYSHEVNQIMIEQLDILADTDVDMFMLETLVDLDCAVALTESALDATQRAGRAIPIHISLTPVAGLNVKSAAGRLAQYTPLSIGLNCFYPPHIMDSLITLLPQDIPLSLRPAISMPGQPEISPEMLCNSFSRIITLENLKYIGTCCGANPIHTQLLKNLIRNA